MLKLENNYEFLRSKAVFVFDSETVHTILLLQFYYTLYTVYSRHKGRNDRRIVDFYNAEGLKYLLDIFIFILL